MVLRDLHDKYVRMRVLRERHGRALADPAWVEPDPRPEMTRLATEFPGSLREIDRLPLPVIDERIAELDAALAGQPPAPWMTAQLLFHTHARAALAAKRWLGRTRTVDASVTAAFVAACPEAAFVAPGLAAIAAPPSGRVMNVVHALVAAQLGLSIDEARRLVFSI